MTTLAPALAAYGLSGRRRSLLLGALLIALTLAGFYPVGHLPFINYDDPLYVTENNNVQPGVNWDTVRWAFTTYHASNWHPVTWLSHALDCQLFALNPAGPHVENLLLHMTNVILLFWILLRATGLAARSALVAGLFAVHPLNVETVAWVSERKNLLSMLFFLLGLGAYEWYARRPSAFRYTTVAVLFAIGLMAKPQIIMMPFVLLLWDYWPLARNTEHVKLPAKSWASLVLEKLPLFAISGACALFTLAAHSRGAMKPLPFSYRVANALGCYVRYLKLAFWPSRLAVYYPHPLVSLRSASTLVALLLLAAITYTVAGERGRRYLVVGWFWFLITLVPMSGIVQVGTQGMADRYAYLPLIGVFLMAVWGAADWTSRGKIPSAVQAAVAIAVLAALVALTHWQLQYWHDSETLWSRTLQVTHENTIAEVNLGAALLQAGEVDRAMERFRMATRIDPRDALSNMYLARYAQMQNRFPEAIERYRTVIDVTQEPGLKARAYRNMGYAYRRLGNEAEAQKSFIAAGSGKE
jgi:tetratricopeptide (TPR) repeat protein